MGTLAMDGLVSGLNTTAIIDAIMAGASANKNLLAKKVAQTTEKKDLWQKFNGYLADIKSAVNGMNTAKEFKKMTATSADTGIVTAAVDGTAYSGSYSVVVTSLSQADSFRSNSQSETDFGNDVALTAENTFSFAVGSGSQVDVDISGDKTMDGIISAINDANAGVFAYRVQDSSGNYYMMLTSEDTGADQAIDFLSQAAEDIGFIPDFSASPEVGTLLNANHISEAQDTVATVNGVTVSSAGRDLKDVIPGVTLSVVDEGTTSVVVEKDLSAMKSAIQSFVDKYNVAMGFINDQIKVTDVKKAGVLSGDSTLRNIQLELQRTATKEYRNSDASFPSSDPIYSLAQVGLKTNTDGTLSIDSDDLSTALDEHFAELIDFFTAVPTDTSDIDTGGLYAAFTNTTGNGLLDTFLKEDGTVDTKLESLDTRIDDLNAHIDSEAARLDKLRETLRKKFSAMEVALNGLKVQQQYVSSVLGKMTTNKN